MSKARVNSSVSVNITGKQQQQQQTKTSILSINVLSKMASSIESTSTSKSTSTFDMSSKLKSSSQQTAASKKKRMALGNISNQNGSSTGENVPTSNSSVSEEGTKKCRYGNNLTNFVSSVNKKQSTSDAQSTLGKKDKAMSKENLASVGRKKDEPKATGLAVSKKSANLTTGETKLTKNGVSKSENDIKKQVDLENRLANASLTASEEKLHSMCNAPAVAAIKSKADLVEGWENIDAADEGDEFTCSDYVEAIFKYYRRREETFAVGDYLVKQKNITKHMRLLLVDWMVEVQQQLEFNHEVLYLSVKLVDLFLNSCEIERDKLQLLAGAAMFIACKFEERMPPIIDDFIFVSDHAYNRVELIKMEIDLLKTVRFDLGAPLSYTFLRRYSKCIRADMKFLTLARYILELSLQDYTFAYERDSLKACASLYLAMKMALAYENNVKMNKSLDNPAQMTVTTSNLTSTEWVFYSKKDLKLSIPYSIYFYSLRIQRLSIIRALL